MATIQHADKQQIVDYMARDYSSLLQAMYDEIPYKLSEWTDYEDDADAGAVLLQLFAHMGDILSYYQDRVANESFLPTAKTRRSIIHHLRLIGYRLATAAPAATTLTLTFAADCDEIITIRRGDAFATKSTKDKPSVRFEYTAEEPLTFDCGELAVTGGQKVFEGVPVEEGRLIEDEVIGTSDGTPHQRFELAHAGVVLRSFGQSQGLNRDLIVQTQLDSERQEWRLQESLAFSHAAQTDFSVEIDENDRATILFGDDAFGAVPPAGAVVRATYRVGGGTKGNVPTDSIRTIVDAPQLSLLAAEITNPEPATGGAGRESIERAVLHAPSVFRSQKRAVTTADYEALALEFTGVGKVRARSTNWNTVRLYVAPEGGGKVSDVLRANLLAYFEGLRPLSTLIEIEDVEYVDVFVTAEVEVVSYYSREQIAEEVLEAAGSLLAFETVDFGKPLFLSKFYEQIEAIDGVAFVNVSEFRDEDDAPDTVEPSGKIEFEPFEIPVGGYDTVIRVIAKGGY